MSKRNGNWEFNGDWMFVAACLVILLTAVRVVALYCSCCR